MLISPDGVAIMRPLDPMTPSEDGTRKEDGRLLAVTDGAGYAVAPKGAAIALRGASILMTGTEYVDTGETATFPSLSIPQCSR